MVAIDFIDCLVLVIIFLLHPFLPFTAEKLHLMLGYQDEVTLSGWSWDPDDLVSGSILPKPKPLFKKLDIDSED